MLWIDCISLPLHCDCISPPLCRSALPSLSNPLCISPPLSQIRFHVIIWSKKKSWNYWPPPKKKVVTTKKKATKLPLKTTENHWRPQKAYPNILTLNLEDHWKPLKITDNHWIMITENHWKPLKTTENHWKPLIQWFSVVFSGFQWS